MVVEAVFKRCQLEACLCVLTIMWLGDFLTVVRRGLQKSDGHILSPGFHSQFFDIQLLKRKPHHNSKFQKQFKSNWSVSMTCGDEFGCCNQSPQEVQVGKVWVNGDILFLQKSHFLREKNIECATIHRYYEAETSRRRIELIRLDNFAMMVLKKHELVLCFRNFLAERSSTTFCKTWN